MVSHEYRTKDHVLHLGHGRVDNFNCMHIVSRPPQPTPISVRPPTSSFFFYVPRSQVFPMQTSSTVPVHSHTDPSGPCYLTAFRPTFTLKVCPQMTGAASASHRRPPSLMRSAIGLDSHGALPPPAAAPPPIGTARFIPIPLLLSLSRSRSHSISRSRCISRSRMSRSRSRSRRWSLSRPSRSRRSRGPSFSPGV